MTRSTSANTRTREEMNAYRRLARVETCTVSYERVDRPGSATLVGEGDSLAARVRDADAQLPAGEWLRVSVSTPASIYGDLIGREPVVAHKRGHNATMNVYTRYEQQLVRRGTA